VVHASEAATHLHCCWGYRAELACVHTVARVFLSTEPTVSQLRVLTLYHQMTANTDCMREKIPHDVSPSIAGPSFANVGPDPTW